MRSIDSRHTKDPPDDHAEILLAELAIRIISTDRRRKVDVPARKIAKRRNRATKLSPIEEDSPSRMAVAKYRSDKPRAPPPEWRLDR